MAPTIIRERRFGEKGLKIRILSPEMNREFKVKGMNEFTNILRNEKGEVLLQLDNSKIELHLYHKGHSWLPEDQPVNIPDIKYILFGKKQLKDTSWVRSIKFYDKSGKIMSSRYGVDVDVPRTPVVLFKDQPRRAFARWLYGDKGKDKAYAGLDLNKLEGSVLPFDNNSFQISLRSGQVSIPDLQELSIEERKARRWADQPSEVVFIWNVKVNGDPKTVWTKDKVSPVFTAIAAVQVISDQLMEVAKNILGNKNKSK